MDAGMILSAAGAGLLSFFSPCILPLLPVYVGLLTTDAANEQLSPGRRLANTVAFVLGICCVFVMLGMGAGVVGATLNNAYLVIALGLLVFVFGLYLAGVIRVPAFEREHRADLGKIQVKGVASAFLLGLAFSFGWTPCVGPVLGTILALAAEQGSVAAGAGLLLVYALGLCVPFLIVTLAANVLLARVRKLHRFLPYIQRVGGALIAVMGLWLVFNQVQVLVAQNQAEDADDAAVVEETVSDEEAEDESASSGATDLVAAARGDHAGDASVEGISSAWKNVVLTDLDGEKHRLNKYKGKPVYFEFWGSWCSSCVADLDQITEVYKEHEELGDVTVLSVVTPGFYGERSTEDFVAWARENNVEVPVLMDTKCSLSQHLGVSAFPTSVFVNSDGTLAKIRLGAIDRDDLEEILAELY